MTTWITIQLEINSSDDPTTNTMRRIQDALDDAALKIGYGANTYRVTDMHGNKVGYASHCKDTDIRDLDR